MNGKEQEAGVRIFDTTLRDGEQTPGVALTAENKVAIAKQLDLLGVDAIEVGFPIASKGEVEGAKAVANLSLKAELCGLARAVKKDVDAVLSCDLRSIHIFIATSELHLQYKLNMTLEEAIRHAVDAVEYAKNHGLTVEFSAEDATRTAVENLKKIYCAVVAAGADRINVPDTVGVMVPQRMRQLIADLKQVVKVPISVHCHNDFGLAVANSLAGWEGGATQIHATINGIGERAGNASLEEVVMTLYSLYRRKININTKLIYETSRLVSRLTGIMIQPNKAIVGENAFAHESGIHTHGVVSMPLTYEPIWPEVVGRSRILVAGKHAGVHGVRKELATHGIHPSEEHLHTIMEQVKKFADQGKTVTTTDLLRITSAVCGEESKMPDILQLKELVVVTGNTVTPTASVKLALRGKEYIASQTGIGPVDAAMKAIQKITDSLVDVRLKEFRLEALTGGTDAVAEVIVKVEDKEGNMVSARAAQTDIVRASVEAMIQSFNRLLQKQTINPPRGEG